MIPAARKRAHVQGLNEFVGDIDAEGEVRRRLLGLDVPEQFQGRERDLGGSVNDWGAHRVPAPSVKTSAVAGECRLDRLALGEAPSDHVTTPSSIRPSSRSTATAPASLSSRETGTAPPRAR